MSIYEKPKPSYETMIPGEIYSADLMTEYKQCFDEGLDIERYRDLFTEVAKLPQNEIKEKFADAIFDIITSAKIRDGYAYVEPSDITDIRALRKPYALDGSVDKSTFEDKLHGAWLGRVCGCMLGKTVEGARSKDLIPFLKETDNYPMHRYITSTDLNKVDLSKFGYGFKYRPYADKLTAMPSDDDTNYTALSQKLLDDCGRDFTPDNVAKAWLRYQPKDAYYTAERVAFCNFVKGYTPPQSAVYKNPYREWIGAQIRTDYYGYINPGNPEAAAEMAWRDASVSHVKNGIYGAMFVSAMLAAAAVTSNVEDIIRVGLAEIPHTSRLYEDINIVLDCYKSGVAQKECLAKINAKYDEYTSYGWCHTNSNAMLVAMSLLYGEGDYGRSICMAVESAFDTDCNGATVGSILGMAYGVSCIDECWAKPFGDTLITQIVGYGTVKISDAAKRTMEHVEFPKY